VDYNTNFWDTYHANVEVERRERERDEVERTLRARLDKSERSLAHAGARARERDEAERSLKARLDKSERSLAQAGARARERDEVEIGLYPIITFQYSSTTLFQVSYHIQYLFF
jgi:hypothetical protein